MLDEVYLWLTMTQLISTVILLVYTLRLYFQNCQLRRMLENRLVVDQQVQETRWSEAYWLLAHKYQDAVQENEVLRVSLGKLVRVPHEQETTVLGGK